MADPEHRALRVADPDRGDHDGREDARDASREQRAVYAIIAIVFGAIAIGIALHSDELDLRAVAIVALALIATIAIVRQRPAGLPTARTRR